MITNVGGSQRSGDHDAFVHIDVQYIYENTNEEKRTLNSDKK